MAPRRTAKKIDSYLTPVDTDVTQKTTNEDVHSDTLVDEIGNQSSEESTNEEIRAPKDGDKTVETSKESLEEKKKRRRRRRLNNTDYKAYIHKGTSAIISSFLLNLSLTNRRSQQTSQR